jgi:hypothetical protein
MQHIKMIAIASIALFSFCGCSTTTGPKNLTVNVPDYSTDSTSTVLHYSQIGKEEYRSIARGEVFKRIPTTSDDELIELIRDVGDDKELKSTIRAELCNRHPEIKKEYRELIITGRFRIGMPKQYVLYSLGRPSNINKYVNAFGTKEQFIYWDIYYLLFENDKLTSWEKY